jgi:RNA recognition motif-containing protein
VATAALRTLYVGGLPPDMDSEALGTLFEEFGALLAARVVMRPSTNTCRGFGYVTFVTEAAARLAKLALDGHALGTTRLRVAEAI